MKVTEYRSTARSPPPSSSELFQRVRLLLSTSTRTPEPPSSATPPSSSFPEWYKTVATIIVLWGSVYCRCCCSSNSRHKVFGYVLHVRLYTSWMQWLIVPKIFQVQWVVLKMCLEDSIRRALHNKEFSQNKATNLQFLRI